MAYGCLGKEVSNMAVTCGANEAITIQQVLYGAEPKGCSSRFTDSNDCQQYR